jgi:hypothetical protein
MLDIGKKAPLIGLMPSNIVKTNPVKPAKEAGFEQIGTHVNKENNASYDALSSTPQMSDEVKSALIESQYDLVDTASVEKPKEDNGAKEEFLDYMNKTPEQRMRANILSKMGYTEEQLAALPDDERKKIEDKIKEMIKEELKEAVRKQQGGDSLLTMSII